VIPDDLLMSIYVVDDNEANRRLLELILGTAGFANIRLFADGVGALSAIQDAQPDIILLDLHMPGIDGFGVLAKVSGMIAADDFLPILVLTADVDRDARTRALVGGATDFLTKPFDAEEVVLRVRNHLRTRRLHRELLGRNARLEGEVQSTALALSELAGEWAAVAASLGRLTAEATAEETATAICAELAGLPDLDGVMLVAFGAAGTTMPLGLAMPADVGLAVNVALPDGRAQSLRSRVTDGPSVGPWVAVANDSAEGPPRGPDFVGAAYVPLVAHGKPLGLLAAASASADALARLTRRLPALEAFAALASALLAPGISERQQDDILRAELNAIIGSGAFTIAFQPIVDLQGGMVVGFEALSRFADGTRPDRRFADAEAVGLGIELQTATLAAAVTAASGLPADAFVSLNVSPNLVLAGDRLARLLDGAPVPIVLEITEHMPVADYGQLRAALDSLGPAVRFAIDDAGAGYSSFRHIVELRPDFVKLDIALVRSIEDDPARQAFVAGMVYFVLRTGCTLIAEGIETAAERDALQGLAVDLGQGYLFGRPEPIAATA
jgi:EAL domain-containing protein (putative c-di-GMP-specific phosphodiesterase class I)/DNA-binding response OmpR family regulator